MTTKMLINASRAQQLRVAIVDGTILQEYQVEIAEKGLSRGNIYRGIVANLQPSLNAAFIDIGEDRHGFLPVADVLPSAYHKKPPADTKRPRVDQVLEKGKPILVQVTKDGVGQKGAALSTNLALAGRYLVLTPFDAVRGISRKASDDEARKTVRKRLQKLDLPDGHGVIVRTNGIDQNQATLNRDLNALLRLWRKINAEGDRGRGAKLIYSDQDLVVQALRDYLDPDIEEVIVDSDSVHAKAESFMKAFMPRSKTRLTRYDERLPLFSRYRLETQIDRIYERAAPLPSGGYLVIDQTEALTAIDVNSGRATRTSNHDESILKINIEAAREVARQLRLRDIGGLIVVDFIDMRLRKHQNKLERTMRDAMKPDKARWSVGRISSNGLLEINRQRIKQALRLRSHHQCPTCEGTGTIPTPEFAAMRLLSKIEARASTQNMASVTVGLHPQMADELQNHYRRDLAELERGFELEIEIIAAPNLKRTEERIEWVQREGAPASDSSSKRPAAISAVDLTPAKKRGRRRKSADDEEQKTAAESTSKSRGGRRRKSDADESDDQAQQAKSTSSRRRRRRRRKSSDSDADSAKQTARADASKADASKDEGDGETTGKTRTSRSRRRSRGGKSTSDDTRRASDKTSSEPSAGDEAKSTKAKRGTKRDASSDEESNTRTRRRRRSRSRGGRRRGGDDEATVETAQADATETTDADAAETSGDDGDEPKTTRRRSRRRRSNKETGDAKIARRARGGRSDEERSDESTDDATPTASPESAASDPEDDDTTTVTRRRRRSRSRSRSDAEGPSNDPGIADTDANTDADSSTDSSTDADGDDDTTSSGSSRRRVRRSRSRDTTETKRPRRAAASSATDDGDDGNESAVAPSADPADDEAEAANAAEATRARRRRRRRTPRAGATDDNGDETSSASADDSAAENEPADSAGGPALENRPHRPELSPRVPGPETDDDGDSAASGSSRWQWWGTPSEPAPEPTPPADDRDE